MTPEGLSDASGEEPLQNHLLHLRSSQTKPLRSLSLEREVSRASTAGLRPNQLLLDRLLSTDPRDDQFIAASIALDQRHLQQDKPLPLLQEDFINILAIQNDLKLKVIPPPANTLPTKMPNKNQKRNGIKIPLRILKKVKPVANTKKNPEAQKPAAPLGKGKSNWRNYPKPWLNGIGKSQGVVKSTQVSAIGQNRKPNPPELPLLPIPEFVLNAAKQIPLGPKTSAQTLIQNYEERKPMDELTYEEAVVSVANTKPLRFVHLKSQENSSSNIFQNSASQAAIDDILERQLEQDPYNNALFYHQQTLPSQPHPVSDNSEPISPEIRVAAFDTPSEFDEDVGSDWNGNPQRNSFSVNGTMSNAPRNQGLSVNGIQVPTNRSDAGFKRTESEAWEEERLREEQAQDDNSQFVRSLNFNQFPERLPPSYPVQDLYGNFAMQDPFIHSIQRSAPNGFIWNGRIHQSNTSFASGALPLYHLNYFPGINDQFPPPAPVLPNLPPPRVPTVNRFQSTEPRHEPCQPTPSFASEMESQKQFQNFPYPMPRPSIFTPQQPHNLRPDPRLILHAQSSRFLNGVSTESTAPLPMHGFPPGDYTSRSLLSCQVPNAPPPTQQRPIPNPLIYSQHSIPLSQFSGSVPHKKGQPVFRSDYEPSVKDFNANYYNFQSPPWEIPYWYPPPPNFNPNQNLANLYKQNYLQKLAMVAQQAARNEEPENHQPRNVQTRREQRAHSRKPMAEQDINNNFYRDASRIPRGVPAQAKVNSGARSTNKSSHLVPASASMSLPTCFSEMEYVGIQEELRILEQLRQNLCSPRSHSADSSCASIRVLLSSRKLQPAKFPRKKVSERALANVKHYGHKLCPCYECRRAHGLYANESQSMSSLEQIDYVRKNIEDLKKYKNAMKTEHLVFVDTPKGDKIPPLIKFAGRKGYGKIPGYLIKRKEELERERRLRSLEDHKKATIDAERDRQEESRRQFQRMERKRAEAKADFCLHLEEDRPKWNPLESNLDSNYNCFLYVNGKIQSEIFKAPSPRRMYWRKDASTGPDHPQNVFNADITAENLKPQKKPIAEAETVETQTNQTGNSVADEPTTAPITVPDLETPKIQNDNVNNNDLEKPV